MVWDKWPAILLTAVLVLSVHPREDKYLMYGDIYCTDFTYLTLAWVEKGKGKGLFLAGGGEREF